jgi:hypothetical protein
MFSLLSKYSKCYPLQVHKYLSGGDKPGAGSRIIEYTGDLETNRLSIRELTRQNRELYSIFEE